VGEAGVTIDAGVSQGCVLVAAEGEDSGVGWNSEISIVHSKFRICASFMALL
jgi:hypothetical protein